jgi:hypothetical protein
MRDGLYKVYFESPLGADFGVVHAVGGKIWGGDSSMFYVGSYVTSGNEITAHVSTKRHSGGHLSVFWFDNNEVDLKGTVQGDTVQFTGRAPKVPNVSFQITLTRIAD